MGAGADGDAGAEGAAFRIPPHRLLSSDGHDARPCASRGTLGVTACAMERVVMNPQFWRNRRVFLTGHTGFKGRWLTRWLTILGAEVRGYSLPDNDVRDLSALRHSMLAAQPEVLFHFAAQALVRTSYTDPVTTFTTNVIGTVNVLESLRSTPSVRAAVLVTSDKCYANSGEGRAFRESDRLGGSDPYSSSKACAEMAVPAYPQSFFLQNLASPPIV